MAGGGGGRRWQEELEPELRPRMFQKILANIAAVCRAVNKSLPERLHEHAAHVEQIAFQTAKDRAAADHQHQMHMVHQMQMANTVQDIQGGNSLFTAIPQAMPMMASPLRPPFQSPSQHMTHPFASTNVNQGPSDMMAMLYQTFNSQPATVAPVAQSIQSSQQIMQPIAMHSHNQRPAMQLQPTNVARYHPASMAQLQGQPIAQPNVCAYAQHLQPTVQQQHFGITQQQVGEQRHQMLGANAVKMNDGYSGGWNNQQNAGLASGIQPLKAREQVALKRQTNMETQSMPPAQRQIAVNQQSNVHCPSPQNQARMVSAGQVDWKEEIVQQIKSMKDTYFSELMELDQNIVLPRLAKEQLKSLPREKADTYNRMSRVKSSIGAVLELFQLKKSLETYRGKLPMYEEMIRNILISYRWKRKANAEMNTGQETKSCPRQPPAQTIKLTSDIAPFTGGKSNQQKLPADESIGQMRQNVVTTPSAGKKTHSNQLQGVTSPCFSIKSPEFEALQSSSTKDVGLCCMLSPIDKLGVTSPNALLKSRSQSPIAKPGFGAAASPCVSVKSTLTSTVEKSGFLEAASSCASVKSASSCASVKSASPSAIAESGVVPVASPSDSDSSFLLHNNAEVNGCNQNTPTKLLTPDSPCQTQTPVGQAEDQEHGEAETQVAKKPIDRLIAAVLSSSPAVLRSSVNLIESALSAMDSVPLRIGSSIKMKRVYDVTSPSESPTLGSMDGSTVTFEFDASDSASSRYPRVKRQKTQNTKDALLDEIEAVNSRLIDTVISITSDDREDEITSGDSVTLIKLSYTPVSLAPSLKSPFATSGNHQPLVMPMTLLIAADYPRSSPVIMDNEGDGQLRTKFSCISMVADAAFRLALRNLQEPRSLKETAMVWDSCVRSAITEYACQLGGGTLSSSLGRCGIDNVWSWKATFSAAKPTYVDTSSFRSSSEPA
ncbi:hypothetical protein BAE44_0006398 [Dichanthelium oligosanthes]|uniref:Mediator of RNA polymerase II transcription subunit 15a n=1 Tax=Dichanthelium oligosanthes TaxID=888268 RepID=A0A1E5W584_9POAL|nr:hypothetical protein BAE44_0006398 [Dichanthelium oligosanthes]